MDLITFYADFFFFFTISSVHYLPSHFFFSHLILEAPLIPEPVWLSVVQSRLLVGFLTFFFLRVQLFQVFVIHH